MPRLGFILITVFVFSGPSLCHAQSSTITKETYRRLAMEHADCAMFYLASSMCSQSNAALAAQAKSNFEAMMQRAYRFAAEGGMAERTLKTYGNDTLEEINKEIGGDCKRMPVLQNRYKTCKALAEDFGPRGREIIQELLQDR